MSNDTEKKKVVIPLDMGKTITLGDLEPDKWNVKLGSTLEAKDDGSVEVNLNNIVDGDTINVKNGKLEANIPDNSGGSVQFATEAEIDAGGSTNANKAVSAEEYHKEIRINDTNTIIGNLSHLGKESYDINATKMTLGIVRVSNSNSGYAIPKGKLNTIIGGVYSKGTIDNSIFLTRTIHSNNGGWNNVIALRSPRGSNELCAKYHIDSNHTVIGDAQMKQVYLYGQVHGQAFLNSSDERLKRKISLVNTLPNGIEIWKYQYLANGNTQIGWIAQQVEDVLRAKGYDEETIRLAIPMEKDIDWHSTITEFNSQTGSTITLWTEAEEVFEEYKLAEAHKLNVTEDTVEEFIKKVEAIKEADRTEWQQSTYDTLQSMQLENYYVYADDIRSINKDTVRDLLGE